MKITDLKKQQGSFQLNVKNAQFEQGKVHGIIGSNGSGKTTLSKIIMGTIPYDSGNIDYEGLTPRDITMTGQRPYLMHTNVYNNLVYPLKVRGQQIDESYADYWLEKAGLQDKKKQYALSLSSGEQQKLSFIRALIFKPKLVIVDETLSNLDPDSADLFEKIILEQLYQKKKRKKIAEENFMSEETVKIHIRHILRKLEFDSTAEMIRELEVMGVMEFWGKMDKE